MPPSGNVAVNVYGGLENTSWVLNESTEELMKPFPDTLT